MTRVRVTRDAERDLDEIWLHIAGDSVDAANHFVDELAARCPHRVVTRDGA
jgi:plasmid stabilization system protein ParE